MLWSVYRSVQLGPQATTVKPKGVTAGLLLCVAERDRQRENSKTSLYKGREGGGGRGRERGEGERERGGGGTEDFI